MPRWIHEAVTSTTTTKRRSRYRSRASYKLKQLNEEFGFFQGAKRVLDLGAAQGGWLQVAVRPYRELVIGVDLKRFDPLDVDNVETIVGDVSDRAVQKEILDSFDGKWM